MGLLVPALRSTAGSALAAVLLAAACARPEAREAEPASTPAVTAKAAATFVNRVWKVAESNSVAPGQLYVFLSEGTLVIASQTGTPSLGTWSREGDALRMVEEGISYEVDVLGSSDTEFRIRIHNPGEPVEIRFVPADGP